MAAAPYFEGDGITLYLGDCLEVTEWLAADVLVTDPPYGRNWRQGRLSEKHQADDSHPGIQGDEDTSARDNALQMWGARPAMVFGDLVLPPPAGTRQVLVFRKPASAGFHGAFAGFRRDAEAVYIVGDSWPTGLGGETSVLTTGAQASAGVQARAGHPHAKPLDIMQTLVMATGFAGPVVADPFAGSGSTLVAAQMQGRPAIGVEIEERYCELAAHRLSQGVLFVGGGAE
jgi:DNA methylase